ncbi:DUF397 domain-containing protein [Actinomadura sp. 9N407]
MELARQADAVLVRDSKDPDGDRLSFQSAAFAGLLVRVKRGEFSL